MAIVKFCHSNLPRAHSHFHTRIGKYYKEELPMNTEIKRDTDIIVVRNEKIEVASDFRFDKETGEKVSDNTLDNAAIQKAFNIYRNRHDVLDKNEIKEIRNRYEVSQRTFAVLTGIGVATIARYETGQIPTNANNELLKSIRDNFRFAQELFNQNSEQLSQKSREKLEDKMSEIAEENSTNEVVQFAEKRIEGQGPSIYTGYRSFEFEKFKQLVLFFAEKVSYLSKTKLNKLLFYSDFKSFQQELLSMTGLSYKRDYYGPVPIDFELLYSALNESDAIMWRIFPSGKGEYIVNKTSFNPDVFSQEELEIMQEVKNTFKQDNAEEISGKSHEEIGYIETEMKRLISYDYADHLKYL